MLFSRPKQKKAKKSSFFFSKCRFLLLFFFLSSSSWNGTLLWGKTLRVTQFDGAYGEFIAKNIYVLCCTMSFVGQFNSLKNDALKHLFIFNLMPFADQIYTDGPQLWHRWWHWVMPNSNTISTVCLYALGVNSTEVKVNPKRGWWWWWWVKRRRRRRRPNFIKWQFILVKCYSKCHSDYTKWNHLIFTLEWKWKQEKKKGERTKHEHMYLVVSFQKYIVFKLLTSNFT